MKKILSFLLATVSVLSLAACGSETEKPLVKSEKGEALPVYKRTFDLFGKDVMPLGTFCGPAEGMLTDDYFKELQELDVNYFSSTIDAGAAVTYDAAMDFLDLCDEYGFGAFLTDSTLSGHANATAMTSAKIDNRLKNYISHKSFLGVELQDEPSVAHMRKLANTVKAYKESTYGSEYELYSNALPDYAGAASLSGESDLTLTYEQYCKHYIELLQVSYFSYDFYPFGQKDGVSKDYFKCMATVRNVCEEYKIPFWTFIQCGGDFGWKIQETFPNEEKFKWNINTCLAYGAKGMQYFPLYQWEGFLNPEDPLTNERAGIYGNTLQKNQWYDYALRANKCIRAVEKILMNSANVGVIFSGTSSPAPASTGKEILTTFRQLQSVSGNNSLVGCFDYKGGTALYVVNNSCVKNDAQITLNFDNNYQYNVTINCETSVMKGETITLTLDAGEGALVVLD